MRLRNRVTRRNEKAPRRSQGGAREQRGGVCGYTTVWGVGTTKEFNIKTAMFKNIKRTNISFGTGRPHRRLAAPGAKDSDQGRVCNRSTDRPNWSRRVVLTSAWRLAVSIGLVKSIRGKTAMAMSGAKRELIELPTPRLDGDVSLENALLRRRSVREFTGHPLSLAHAAQLLWAGQGVTSDWGGRTAPSAGALYPLELYLVAGAVSELPAGLYRFQPRTNELMGEKPSDLRTALAASARGQGWIATAPAIVIVTAVEQRTAAKYGRRAARYVQIEAGHAAQNVALQAVALGLGCTPVGAFDDEHLHSLLGAPAAARPLYLLPVGYPA